MEAVVAIFVARSRYLYLEGLGKTTNFLSQVNRCVNQDSNQASSEYKSEALPPELTCPVKVRV
jgi:hypothetical protein